MKTIIAGTDFSKSSINACNYAAFLSQKLNCKLVLFNLYEAPVVHSNMGLFGINIESSKIQSFTKTESQLNNLKKKFPKVKMNFFITHGDFKTEIENFVSNHQVQAAVLGLESKHQLSKYIFGSTGVSIAGKIEAPVIIVPEEYKKHKLNSVMLAIDNTEQIKQSSLKHFAAFVEQSKVRLKPMHIRTVDEFISPKVGSLKFAKHNYEIQIHNNVNVSEGIRTLSKSGDYDLIGIISKKHSTIYNFFQERNTKKIAFSSKLPVMAIHE